MREAGELARATSRGPFKRWTKGDDNSPVSDGDIAVNDLLRTRLDALAPDAGWLSEETEDHLPGRAMAHRPGSSIRSTAPAPISPAAPTGRFRWRWSRTAARVLAALYAPVTDEMFLAVARQGRDAATAPPSRRAAATRSPAPSSPDPNAISTGSQASPRTFSPSPRCIRSPCGSPASRMAELDAAFASPGSHDWDLAAADLLVHEAGGVMTDFAGTAAALQSIRTSVHGALIAAGPARHATLIDLVRDRQPEFA